MAERISYKVEVDGVSRANTELDSLAKGFKDVASNAIATGVAFGAFTKQLNFAGQSVEKFFTQKASVNRIEAALISTGNSAGKTSKELQALASQMQAVSNFGDEQIMSEAINSMLTFKNVTGDTFDRSIKAVADMSIVTGSLSSATMMLGRVLNDPIANLGAMTRAGIQFTESQKEQIKYYQETNQLAKAQSVILAEIESQFGGLAEAASDPLTQLSNKWGDVQEEIGKSFAPFFDNISAVVNSLGDVTRAGEIFANSLKIGLGIAAGVTTVLISRMLALTGVMATLKAVSGDWISLIAGASVGIATVFGLTHDWTNAQKDINQEISKSSDEIKNLTVTLSLLEQQQQKLNDIQAQGQEKASGLVGKYISLTTELESLSAIQDKNIVQQAKYEDAIKDFNSTFGSYVGMVDDAIIKNNDLSKSFQKVSENIVKQSILKGYAEQIELIASNIARVQTSEDYLNQDAYRNRIKLLQESNRELDTQRLKLRELTNDEKALGLTKQAINLDAIAYNNEVTEKQKTNLLEIASLQSKLASSNLTEQEEILNTLIAKYQETASLIGEIVFNPKVSIDGTAFFGPSKEEFEQAISIQQQYYDQVKFLDDDYYNYREQLIQEQYNLRVSAGISEVDAHRASLESKKELDKEYYDWQATKWRENNEFLSSTLDVGINTYRTFAQTLVDTDMSADEKRRAIWNTAKAGFVNMLVDMTAKAIEHFIITETMSKSAQASSIATSAITGQAIAASYASAAALASLASFGANAIPASAGITSTVGLAQGLALLNSGGEVKNGDNANRDSVLALLTKGEAVVNRDGYQANRSIIDGIIADPAYVTKNYTPNNQIGMIDSSSRNNMNETNSLLRTLINAVTMNKSISIMVDGIELAKAVEMAQMQRAIS